MTIKTLGSVCKINQSSLHEYERQKFKVNVSNNVNVRKHEHENYDSVLYSMTVLIWTNLRNCCLDNVERNYV